MVTDPAGWKPASRFWMRRKTGIILADGARFCVLKLKMPETRFCGPKARWVSPCPHFKKSGLKSGA